MEDTKERIVRQLRTSEEPALSASNLAELLEVSTRTIHNHMDELVDDDRVQETQIGNAQAYFIPFDKLPAHKKPDHKCKRCGRVANDYDDFARIDMNTYFESSGIEDSTPDYYTLCRFCYDDFVGWVQDPGTIGDYPKVHSWSIPQDQLEDVQENEDIVTTPGDVDNLNEDLAAIYNHIDENEDDIGVYQEKIIKFGKGRDMLEMDVKRHIRQLKQMGYIHMPGMLVYKTAK